jgi:Bax protein
VRAYVHNLNTHPPYREFRVLRERLRARGERLSGLRLADALGEYSERAAAYVVEIKAMIRQNELEPAQTS